MKQVITFLLLLASLTFQAQVNDLLIARNTGKFPIWNGDTIRVFGFTKALKAEVKIPGPTLIYNEGDSVTIDLWNVSQGAPHTIHLHGLDVNQANDGVPHLSFDVAHMDHGFYHFIAPHPGTYLYHCHVVSTIHVQAGMYGLIIIRPSDGSYTTWDGGHKYDKEVSWMTSELDTNWHKDDVLEHPHDTGTHIMPVKIPEFHPQHFLVNGLSKQQLSDSTVSISSSANEKVYLRIANIGYYGNKIKIPSGFNARVVSSDGRPLPTEEVSDSLTIYPGERYSLLLQATSQFAGNITIDYFNLNTGITASSQSVPVAVNGFFTTQEKQFPKLALYPNPANTIVTFEMGDFDPISWRLYDVVGNLHPISINKKDEGQYWCGIHHLPKGCYYIKATDKNGQTVSATLIRQ